MDQIAISKFKATCLAVLERVRRTRKPVRITRFGEPMADILPPGAPPRPEGWIGSMRQTGRVAGDIISPAAEEDQWESLRP